MPFALPPSRSPSRPLPFSSPPRRESSTSTRRQARPARPCGTSSRTRPVCRSRERSRSLDRGGDGSTRTKGSACSPHTSRIAPRCTSPTTCARRSACRSASALDPAGDPGSGMHASLGDVLALARELLEPTLVAKETLDEMAAVQFPGLSGVLPDLGRFDPLDWGLGVQLNTSLADVDGDEDLRARLRPLRRIGDVPLGRPRRSGRLCRLDGPRVRRVGEGGVAKVV